MSALHTLDVRLFEALAGTRLSPAERDRAIDLCESVVAMVPELDLALLEALPGEPSLARELSAPGGSPGRSRRARRS